MLPLTDASRDSRIHDWIAEQYSFALSEFQDDHLWRDDPPSLRESKLLPDNFDLITRPPPPPQRDSDSDRDSLYDPPLLPSPLPLLRDSSSDNTPPQACTDLEDAFGGLLREMNSWRFAPASRSALTLTLPDRNKVRAAPQLNLLPWVHSPTQALPSPPSLPPTPTLEHFPSPPVTAPSSPTSSSFPATPASSFRPLHRRSKALDHCHCPSTAGSDSEPTLTSSASYASLRSRGSRYPSISTTLSTADSSFTPSVRHAIYVSPPKTSPPPSPTTPTPVERAPPTMSAPSTPPLESTPVVPSTERFKVYPSGLAAGESSRWSVASTSLHSLRSPTPTPNSMPILPTFVRPKSKRELPSIRTRLLSTFGLRPRNSAPPSPTTGSAFSSNSRRNSHRTSWSSATTRRRRVDSNATLSIARGEKQLIVSGLDEGNLEAEVAVKRWCEVRVIDILTR